MFLEDQKNLLRGVIRDFQAARIQIGNLPAIAALLAALARGDRSRWKQLGRQLRVALSWWKTRTVRRELKKWNAAELRAGSRLVFAVANAIPINVTGSAGSQVSPMEDPGQPPRRVFRGPAVVVRMNSARAEVVLDVPEPNSRDLPSNQATHGSASE